MRIPWILPGARILPQESESPFAWRDASRLLWRPWLLGQRAGGHAVILAAMAGRRAGRAVAQPAHPPLTALVARKAH
jgi:hypothetical protein